MCGSHKVRRLCSCPTPPMGAGRVVGAGNMEEPRAETQRPPSPPQHLAPLRHPQGHSSWRSVCVWGVPPARGPVHGTGCGLTLQAWPSSRAALWASAGFSITLPVCPEKSIATREFSETLRWKERPQVLKM